MNELSVFYCSLIHKCLCVYMSEHWCNYPNIVQLANAKAAITKVTKLNLFSMHCRNSKPFGNIIKISEGEYGLPHKMFYNLDAEHEVRQSIILPFPYHHKSKTLKTGHQSIQTISARFCH